MEDRGVKHHRVRSLVCCGSRSTHEHLCTTSLIDCLPVPPIPLHPPRSPFHSQEQPGTQDEQLWGRAAWEETLDAVLGKGASLTVPEATTMRDVGLTMVCMDPSGRGDLSRSVFSRGLAGLRVGMSASQRQQLVETLQGACVRRVTYKAFLAAIERRTTVQAGTTSGGGESGGNRTEAAAQIAQLQSTIDGLEGANAYLNNRVQELEAQVKAGGAAANAGASAGASLAVGTRVKAMAKGFKEHYPGEIEAMAADGTYSVKYDDGDHKTGIPMSSIIVLGQQPSAGALAVGTRVEAMAKGFKAHYPGEIEAVAADGTYSVKYDDGDHKTGIPASMIRLEGSGSAPAAPAFVDNGGAVNAGVAVNVTLTGGAYPGRVWRVNMENMGPEDSPTFDVDFDDGDRRFLLTVRLLVVAFGSCGVGSCSIIFVFSAAGQLRAFCVQGLFCCF